MPRDWGEYGYGPPESWTATRDAETGILPDEWGVGWVDPLMPRVATHPLQGGYHLLETYPFPDPHAQGRFDAVKQQITEGCAAGKYILAQVWFTLFERLWFLRGFNELLTDIYLAPESFAGLRDRIVEFNLAMIRQWTDLGVDGIWFSDDWGTQQALLMRPEDWREQFLPSYKRMFDAARAGGAQVWMHLCGNVTAIVGNLVEAGLNVLNPLQSQALDLEQLARDFGGKLCFHGGIDVQKTLPFGTPQQVRDEVRWLCERLGGTGGYIASSSHSIMPETPIENLIAMFEALEEHTARG